MDTKADTIYANKCPSTENKYRYDTKITYFGFKLNKESWLSITF